MEGIIIDVSQSCTGADYEIADVHLYAAADNPVTVSGVPAKPGGCTLSALKLVVTNADGVEAEYACLKTTDGYTAVVPASHLATYGEIEKGLRVMATGTYGGAEKSVCLGIAKLTVVSGAAWAAPGTGSGVSGVMEGTTLATATLADLKLAVRQIGQVLGATVAALAVMCSLSLGAATVTKAPLKSLLIDNASVVTDVEFSGTDAAKRLESWDGGTWIDAAGDVHQVQAEATHNGMTAAAEINDASMQWRFNDPAAQRRELNWNAPDEWALFIDRYEDVENAYGEIVQQLIVRTYRGTAAWPCESVTLKDGDGIAVTVSLRTVTNVVNKVAFTNDVPNVAGGGISTNDVCDIVSNTVPGIVSNSVPSIVTNEVVIAHELYRNGVLTDEETFAWRDSDSHLYVAVYDVLGEEVASQWYTDRSEYEQARRNGIELTGRRGVRYYIKPILENSIGMATMKDVERRPTYDEVTNEVEVLTDWVITCEDDFVRQALEGSDIRIVRNPYLDGELMILGYPILDNDGYLYGTRYATPAADGQSVAFPLYQHDGEIVYVTATRSRTVRNALGLAMLKDLEPLPTYEAVTNTARDVSNTFWDDKNSVLWKIAFKDGEPMFLPLTNENVSVTGGVE